MKQFPDLLYPTYRYSNTCYIFGSRTNTYSTRTIQLNHTYCKNEICQL